MMLLVFLFLLLIIVDINSLKLSQEQNSTDINLEAPHLGDESHSNRPPIEPSTNITKKRRKPKKIINKYQDLINPCGGSFKKTNGTTCGLKQIMIGRCLEFEYIKGGFSLSNQSYVYL